jgi:hypothetical protein
LVFFLVAMCKNITYNLIIGDETAINMVIRKEISGGINFMSNTIGLTEKSVVADIGSGTGISSKLFLYA